MYRSEPYRPNVEKVRIYSDLMTYNGDISNSISSALIDFHEFQHNYGLIYFDLSKTGNALNSDSVDLNIKYTLDHAVIGTSDYKIHALVLHESNVTLKVINNRAFLEVN